VPDDPERMTPTSRKGFLTAAATGAATLLAGCGQDDAPGAPGGAGARDAATLNRALGLEYASVALYTAGRARTSGRTRRAMTQLLDQERDHARGLTEAIRDLGGRPRRPLSGAAYRKQLGVDRASGTAFLRAAARVEQEAIAWYLETLPGLTDGRLRQTAAAILASEAEHAAVLTGLREPGRPALQAPLAFVGGQ